MSQEQKIKQNVSQHKESSNVLISTAKPFVSLNSVIPCENFSNFDKLIHVTISSLLTKLKPAGP